MIRELLATLRTTRQENGRLQDRLDQLLRRLYGPRGERWDPNQPLLFPELAETTETAATPPAGDDETAVPKKKRKHTPHGRRKLPANLKRDVRVHDKPEAERLCPCCGKVCQPFGKDISEQLDYQPSSLYIIEHQCIKYACPECHNHVTTATKPPPPIDKGMPGPGLLAIVTVSKYDDHLPLHRLERIFARSGFELSRQTSCDWMAQAARLLEPLYGLMIKHIMQGRSLHTDDTPVKVFEAEHLRTGRMWVYVGDRDHPYNLFDFSVSRERTWPLSFLGTWSGYLHADAFSGYDALFIPRRRSDLAGSDLATAQEPMYEVACWAHARRKFYEARASDTSRAHQALARIRKLYDAEDEAKQISARDQLTGDAADVVRWQLRQQLALPELTAMRQWLLEEQKSVLPKSPMGEAITYALNQWEALTRYTDAGFLDIDNNVAERTLRSIAIGRKNWLFCGSAAGGKTAAILFSFTSTCRRLGIDSFAYLRDLFERLPSHPAERLPELLPEHWQAARAAQTGEPPATAPPQSAPVDSPAAEPAVNPPASPASSAPPTP